MDVNIKEMIFCKDGNGIPLTDTRKVAKFFGRQHKNILKSARRLYNRGLTAHIAPMQDGRYIYFILDVVGFDMLTKTLPGCEDKRKEVLALMGQLPSTEQKVLPVKIEDVIHVRKSGEKVAINARELHAFLSKRDFTTWMKDRIERCDLIEGEDFTKVDEYDSRVGRPSTEFALSIDAAKEICMVEGNEKGKRARRYFIEVEKKFRNIVQTQMQSVPQTFAQALRLAAQQAEEIEAQQKKIEADAPKVTFATAVETSQSSCLIGELAKMLCQNGVQTGEKRLFAWMREKGYLCSFGERYNQPTQKAMEMGLFKVKKQTWTKPNGEVMTSTTTKVTGKGQIYFINKLMYNQQNQMQK